MLEEVSLFLTSTLKNGLCLVDASPFSDQDAMTQPHFFSNETWTELISLKWRNTDMKFKDVFNAVVKNENEMQHALFSAFPWQNARREVFFSVEYEKQFESNDNQPVRSDDNVTIPNVPRWVPWCLSVPFLTAQLKNYRMHYP